MEDRLRPGSSFSTNPSVFRRVDGSTSTTSAFCSSSPRMDTSLGSTDCPSKTKCILKPLKLFSLLNITMFVIHKHDTLGLVWGLVANKFMFT
eukprot:scaffold165067_cov43-Prasinocladus_malaysianus.AAC.1